MYIIFIVLLVIAVAWGIRQTRRVQQLEKELREKESGKICIPENTYAYLAIGNSLTEHGVTDFWWQKIGMAATRKENDYVHLVSAALEKEKGKVFCRTFNFFYWEVQAHDRGEMFPLVDSLLSSKWNLITIQLGENATNIDTIRQDYGELIRHLKKECPQAKIIMVGDFWNAEKNQIRKDVSAEFQIPFVDLSPIYGKDEYKCGLGTTVYDAEGKPHEVRHEGVAQHPGDKGMQYIADGILGVMKES